MVAFQKLGPEAGWQETDVPSIAKEPQGRAQKSGCSSERSLCIWEVVKYTLKFFPRCRNGLAFQIGYLYVIHPPIGWDNTCIPVQKEAIQSERCSKCSPPWKGMSGGGG